MSLQDEIKKVLQEYRGKILTLPHVIGVGIGYRITARQTTAELSIMILVRKKLPPAGLEAKAIAPQEIQGVRTDVLEVGDIRPLLVRTDPWRPAPGGVSLGHYKISAGTFGCVVYDAETGARLILSNNHVLANINDAVQGDPILQPGPVDGGQVEQHTIARLERFCSIDFGSEPASCDFASSFTSIINLLAGKIGSAHKVEAYQEHPSAINLVDAAVARPVDDADVSDEILEIGRVDGLAGAELGMSVRKSGRTTALTSGEITVLDATVNVSYGSGLSATFEDQIVTTAMSQGGDSGSLLVAGSSNHAVGLLFAGSDISTIHNPIHHVQDCLSVQFVEPAAGSTASKQAMLEKAHMIKESYREQLMSFPNVVGVGVGYRHAGGQRTDDIAVVVMVDRKIPLAQLDQHQVIPDEIEGVPVDVKEVGRIEVQTGLV